MNSFLGEISTGKQEANDSIVTASAYHGIVNFKVISKKGHTKIDYTGHNEGTINLSKIFAMLMTGNTEALNYVPRYIDLQTRPAGSTSAADWESILRREPALTGISYYKESDNWVAVGTGIVPYAYLMNAIDSSSNAQFRLVLKSDTIKNAIIDRELAYFDSITAKQLSAVTEGAQAIIQWKMQLVHEA